MKIQIYNQRIDKIARNVQSSVDHILNNVGPDVNVEDIKYDMEIILKFKIEGREEYQVVTTDRDIFGMKELYTIRPFFTEDGDLLEDAMLDNKEETFEKVAEALDKELPTVAIESEYTEDDLIEKMNEFAAPDGSLREVLHRHKDGYLVLQYFRGGVGLVHELQLSDKAEGMENQFEVDSIIEEPQIIDAEYEEVTEEYPSCGFTKCTTCE